MGNNSEHHQVGKISRALISVSDKSGIVELAGALSAKGVEILSTGGTAKLLREAGLDIVEVSDYTGFPEMMDGRVKTLHPKIHGGILGRRGTDDEVMLEYNIGPIDLVVVNLYPFESTIANLDCELATAIENIDIGGPTMLRAAAKNHRPGQDTGSSVADRYAGPRGHPGGQYADTDRCQPEFHRVRRPAGEGCRTCTYGRPVGGMVAHRRGRRQLCQGSAECDRVGFQ